MTLCLVYFSYISQNQGHFTLYRLDIFTYYPFGTFGIFKLFLFVLYIHISWTISTVSCWRLLINQRQQGYLKVHTSFEVTKKYS